MVELSKESELVGDVIAKLKVNNVTDNVEISEYERKLAEKELEKLFDFLDRG